MSGEFTQGGTFEDEFEFVCPHCWEQVATPLDLTVDGDDIFVDCPVCCNPIEIVYTVVEGEVDTFEAEKAY